MKIGGCVYGKEKFKKKVIFFFNMCIKIFLIIKIYCIYFLKVSKIDSVIFMKYDINKYELNIN